MLKIDLRGRMKLHFLEANSEGLWKELEQKAQQNFRLNIGWVV
jgi:hypothetical protein